MNTYIFRAYNTESQYGYGTEKEAIKYCEYLNQNREIHLFYFEVIDVSDEQIENLTFNLLDALGALEDI